MQRSYLFLSSLVLASLLAGCASSAFGQPDEVKSLEDYRMPTDLPDTSSLTKTAQTEIAASIPPADCPVTTVTGSSVFEAPAPYSPNAPWQNIFWFGSEHLWTALNVDGVWADLPRNPGGYTQKIMWWSSLFSLKDELEPALVVFGERLDAKAPPLNASKATNASAADIGSAMLVGVDFPTEGCWKVTGQYKKTELKFVVWLAQ